MAFIRPERCCIIRFKQMAFANSETTEHVRTTLGAALRRRREVKELGLADVAGPAHISVAFLSEVERGLKDISTERLLRVARALETTVGDVYLELAHELGAGEPLNAVAWEANPRVQLRRMAESLDGDALRTVARFTTFLAMTESAPKKRPIGFLR
jgi:transcriptional regulator with XRE-family HTH domain